MISVSLPPVFFGGRATWGEAFEAFAMLYWSQYNTMAISPRVLQSMQRAWSLVDVTMYPRTPTVPGMLAARIGSNGAYRLVIAIEGSQSAGNIFTGPGFLAGVTVPGCTGHVVKYAKDAYTALAALPAPMTVISDALANPAIPVTFVGHSLGASAAEIWACAIKAAQPGKTVKYFAFGGPRVGNQHWYRNAARKLVEYRHIYTETDPIHSLPQDSSFSSTIFPISGLLSYTRYSREENCDRITVRGTQHPGLPPLPWTHPSWTIGQLSKPLVEGGTWFEHPIKVYRAAMMAKAAVMGPELSYRFLHMEYENENQWQVLWRNGGYFAPSWNNLILPGPAPVEPPNADVAALAGIAPPTVQPQGTGDAINSEPWSDDAFDAPTWTAPPVVQTQFEPQRRVRRVLGGA